VFVAAQPRAGRDRRLHVHRGCLAIRRAPAAGRAAGARAVVALEDLTDVDNLGALARHAAGVRRRRAVLSPRCADPFYRKAIRVSLGAVFGCPIVRAQRWPEDLQRLRRDGRCGDRGAWSSRARSRWRASRRRRASRCCWALKGRPVGAARAACDHLVTIRCRGRRHAERRDRGRESVCLSGRDERRGIIVRVVSLKADGQGAPLVIAGGVFIVVWLVCFALVAEGRGGEMGAWVGRQARVQVRRHGRRVRGGRRLAFARRLERGGPEVKRQEWTLHAADFGAGQIANLQRGLDRHGYQIRSSACRGGRAAKAVVPTQPLRARGWASGSASFPSSARA
jgi:hypothetical protein